MTTLSTQVVGLSLLSLGHDNTGGGMVAVWLMQVVAVVMVGAVAGSCRCRVGGGCHRCHLVNSAGGGQCHHHRPSSIVHGGAVVVIADHGGGHIDSADGGDGCGRGM